MPDRCLVPPQGWLCTREPGHDGPCAAHPVHETENRVSAYFALGGPSYEDAIMEVVAVHEAMQADDGDTLANACHRGLTKTEAKRLVPVAIDLATYALGVVRGDIEAVPDPVEERRL